MPRRARSPSPSRRTAGTMSTEHEAPWPTGVRQRYLPIREIGVGGMGLVWLARSVLDPTPLAIKTILPRLRRDYRARQRFIREATAVFRLRHPHIVRLVDFYENPTDGAMAMVMEYVDGDSLATFRKEPLPWSTLRILSLQILDALAFAHGLGVVHRDLKPENVLLATDPLGAPMAKLVDFGIVHLAEPDNVAAGVRITGATHLGTPPYVAPELLLRPDLTAPSSDIHSFGVLLWELICGSLPWDVSSPAEILHHKLHGPTPVYQPRPAVGAPPEIETILRTCLSPVPVERDWFMADLRRAIEALPEFGDEEPSDTPVRGRLRLPGTGPVLGTGVEPDTEEFPALQRALEGQDVDLLQSGALQVGPGAARFVREPPFLGRHPERRFLRGVVAEVTRERTAQGVLLVGAAGAGKSRLIQWLRSLLVYEGIMMPVVVDMATSDPEDALRRALLTLLGHGDLVHAEDHGWFERALAHLGIENERTRRQLIEDFQIPVDPTMPGETPMFSGRWYRLVGLLARVAQQRPICLVLEGVRGPWTLTAIRLALSVLDAPAIRSAPVLVLVSISTDAPTGVEASRNALERHLDDLRRHLHASQSPATRRCTLRPLPLLDHETVRSLLEGVGATPDLASRIARVANGLPTAALELFWIFGPDLPATAGLTSRELLALALSLRIEMAADTRERANELLELLHGLSLGPETMSIEDIRGAVQLAMPDMGSNRLYNALHLLVAEHFLHERRSPAPGVAFRQGLWRRVLRDAVERSSRANDWIRAWERVLQAGPASAERHALIGAHLVRLAERESACSRFVLAGDAALADGDLPLAQTLFGTAARIAAALPEAGPARDRSRAARAGLVRVALAEGRLDEALRTLERTASTDPAGMPRTEGELHPQEARIRAAVSFASGDLQSARRALHEGLERTGRTLQDEERCLCLLELGTVEFMAGRLRQAERLLHEALDFLVGRPPSRELLACRTRLARTLCWSGDVVEAEQQLGAAHLLAHEWGERSASPRIQLVYAELALRQGAWDSAATFIEGARLRNAFCHDLPTRAEVLLTQVGVDRTRHLHDRAREATERVEPLFRGALAQHPLRAWFDIVRLESRLLDPTDTRARQQAHEVLDAQSDATLFPPLEAAADRLRDLLTHPPYDPSAPRPDPDAPG